MVFGDVDIAKAMSADVESALDESVPETSQSGEKTARVWLRAFTMAIKTSDNPFSAAKTSRAIWWNTALICMFIAWVVPRLSKKAGGLPSTARQYVNGFINYFARTKQFSISFNTKRVSMVVKGLENRWVKKNGPMVKNRKKGFEPRQLKAWRATNRNWTDPGYWMVVGCMISLAFCGMFRRSEYTNKGEFNPNIQLTRSDVRWQNAKGDWLKPSKALFDNPPKGLIALVSPPPCKNDRTGSKYHNDPLIFEVVHLKLGDKPSFLMAGNWVLELERNFPIEDLAERKVTALFVNPETTNPFRTETFDQDVKTLMRETYEADDTFPPPEEQSLHSFRIGGAICIRSDGDAPADVVKAMGRWSSDAWMLYMRDRRAEAIKWGRNMRKHAAKNEARMDIAERNFITRPHATEIGLVLTPEDELPDLLNELRLMDAENHGLIPMMEEDTLDLITRDEIMEINGSDTELFSPEGFDLPADLDAEIQETKRAKTSLSISADDEAVDEEFDRNEPCFFS